MYFFFWHPRRCPCFFVTCVAILLFSPSYGLFTAGACVARELCAVSLKRVRICIFHIFMALFRNQHILQNPRHRKVRRNTLMACLLLYSLYRSSRLDWFFFALNCRHWCYSGVFVHSLSSLMRHIWSSKPKWEHWTFEKWYEYVVVWTSNLVHIMRRCRWETFKLVLVWGFLNRLFGSPDTVGVELV